MSTDTQGTEPAPDPLLARSLESVRKALSGLRYGSVSITVHEGRVVQIDVTEKLRLDR